MINKLPSQNILNDLEKLYKSNQFLKLEEKLNILIKEYKNSFLLYNILGITLSRLNKFSKAKFCFEKTLEIKPNYIDGLKNLGNVNKDIGNFQIAISNFKNSLKIEPYNDDILNNLGLCYQKLNDYENAIKCFKKALELKPNHAGYLANLGLVLIENLKLTEGLDTLEKAIDLNPNLTEIYSSYIFSLTYKPNISIDKYFFHLKRFRENIKKEKFDIIDYNYSQRPDKLNIGFVSGDFKQHPVGYFLSDTLKHLKKKNLELIAYSNSRKKDSLSLELKSHFIHWHEIADQNNMEVINQIRKDGIHILIDLSGHSKENRLPIFINKPAPIQATWAGFLGSTGIPEIDYIIGDPYVTPKNHTSHFTEKIFRLPNIWCCFSVPKFEIEINELPAIKNRYITFGSFNNLTKINDKVIALWSKILLAVPKSKIFLKTKELGNLSIKKLIINKFKKNKINSSLIILEGASPRNELMATYNKVDIALDPFPYSGGTTSFEATWMGTPVLTKKGFRFISRSTESINHNSGMSDWVAKDDNEYVSKAIKFASNFEQLNQIRMSLREKILNSPPFNASLFAEQFNYAFWKMWNNFSSKIQ